jgi:hypothetical protein
VPKALVYATKWPSGISLPGFQIGMACLNQRDEGDFKAKKVIRTVEEKVSTTGENRSSPAVDMITN